MLNCELLSKSKVRAFFRSITMSGNPPTRVAIAGMPYAQGSNTAIGKFSLSV